MEDKYEIICLFNDQSNKGVLLLYGEENCKITFQMDNFYLEGEAENFFYALIELRKKLEMHNIKLLCKGCSRHVYPSAMILSMGDAVLAYELTLGKQALQKDLVNIFEPCKCDEYASIVEQYEYFEKGLRVYHMADSPMKAAGLGKDKRRTVNSDCPFSVRFYFLAGQAVPVAVPVQVFLINFRKVVQDVSLVADIIL